MYLITRPIICTILLFSWTILNAQIKWDVVSDVTLTPNVIYSYGSVSVHIGNSQSGIVFTGRLQINMNEKTVLFDDGKNLYQFKPSDLLGINLNDYGYYSEDNLFKNNFSDSIDFYYRRLLYPTLNLNEISFSISRRVEYDIENSFLVLKNQKILKGKVCYVDLNSITVLAENGELITMKDGDFIFLEINGTREFYCSQLYRDIFPQFKDNLEKVKVQWGDELKQISLDTLISKLGPFNSISNISLDKRLITWKRNQEATYFDIHSSNSGFSLSENNARSSISSNSSLLNITETVTEDLIFH